MKNIQKHLNYSKQLVHIYLVSSPEIQVVKKYIYFITLEEVLSSDSYSMFS